MKLNKVNSYSQYLEIAQSFKKIGCKSNDYLQVEASDLISKGKLFEYCFGNNAFLFVEKDGFYRMYYYLNDLKKPIETDGIDMVVEILFRGDISSIENEIVFLEECGFKKNLIRDQYAGKYSDFIKPSVLMGNDIVITDAENISEIEWACNLFNGAFDKWSGDYLSPTVYRTLLEKGSIIMAKDLRGGLLGALHQTIDKGVAWISHVAVDENARGKGVGKALMESFVERNNVDEKSRYMLWVQRQNEVAVNMYSKKGFKYINKSTISLIKTN